MRASSAEEIEQAFDALLKPARIPLVVHQVVVYIRPDISDNAAYN
jgi:hypothetical protein